MKNILVNKKGIAIPIVLLFCLTTLFYAGAMIFYRKEVKQENMINVNFLQANFLAQSAVQHVLLKFRVLPQESYDSGVAEQGFCPLWGIQPGGPATGIMKTTAGMDILKKDCNTVTMPLAGSLFDGVQAMSGDWKYKVASLTVISAFTDNATQEMVQTIQITAIGSVKDDRGGRGWRHEEMRKTVEIRRKF